MMTTQSKLKLATLTALLLAGVPLMPAAGACTQGSLLCPLDAVQDDAYAALGDAQDDAFAAPDAADEVMPTIIATEGQAIADANDARTTVFDGASQAVADAFDGVAAAEGMAIVAASSAVTTASGAGKDAGGMGDASLTDGIASAELAAGSAVALAQLTAQTAQDAVNSVPQTVGTLAQPVADLADQVINSDVPGLIGALEDEVNGIEAGPLEAAYESTKTSLVDMVVYNYGLLQARFPAVLPPSSDLIDAAENLP